eukprot:symbB.v1.2.041881.t1/scaffold8799.1/size5018/1
MKHWKEALVHIGLQEDFAVPYQLRHAGASWDRFKKFRTQLEVKMRGAPPSTPPTSKGNAVKKEKGLCCTRLDDQGREICFEDEAQFDILFGVAIASFATMAVIGCLRQAHLRGGLFSRRSERLAAANGFELKREDSVETETDDEVNGFSGSDSEESK